MARSNTTEAAQEATPAEIPFQTYCKVDLAGRLAAAPEVLSTPSGKAVADFRVAINDTRGAHFFDVVSWGSVRIQKRAWPGDVGEVC